MTSRHARLPLTARARRWSAPRAVSALGLGGHGGGHGGDGSLLAVDGVTVRFGGVVANNDVSFACREGAITALLGPNGAGKTTMFNVISGEQKPTAGRVFFAGREITGTSSEVRARMGMARTFQNLAVVNDLTVLENVRVGASRFSKYGVTSALLGLPVVARTDRVITEIARRALATVGLSNLEGMLASALPYGDLRRLELARALCLGPRMLLLDEPAAGLDTSESRDLVAALRGIRDHWGVTVLLVEHDLELIRTLAEDAFVLDFGVLLAGGSVQDVLNDPAVIEAYLGTGHAHAASGRD